MGDPTSMLAPSRDRPLPPEWTVLQARDAYLAENGFTIAGYDEPTAEIKFFGIPVSIPNPPARQTAVRLHDLHHAATGYGTDFRGEWEISAWELRKGVRDLGLYVGAIVTLGALTGLFLAPIRTIRAWRHASEGKSLFRHHDHGYEALLAMSLGELRRYLGIAETGLADRPRALHASAPTR